MVTAIPLANSTALSVSTADYLLVQLFIAGMAAMIDLECISRRTGLPFFNGGHFASNLGVARRACS
jgi:uncharacterized protein (DUF2164 family)